MSRDITIKFDPSDGWWKNTLENLWVTILEGGSNYWVDGIYHDETKASLKNGADLAKNFHIIIRHGADEFDSRDYGETTEAQTFDVIHKGISLLSDDVKLIIMNNGDWDANDADHILQLGVFGEVRYG